jgi:hypothetical protein
MKDILSPLAKKILANGEEDRGMLEQYKIERDIHDISQARDVYEDNPRDRFMFENRDSTNEMLRASSFLKDYLKKVNIPIVGYRYENMNIEKWADGNLVKEGVAKFSVDVIDKLGAKKTFTVPVSIAEGEVKEPEYFLDSVGRKYAFSREGIEDYMDEQETDLDESVSYNESKDIINRQESEQPALAESIKHIKKIARLSDSFEETAFRVAECKNIDRKYMHVYAKVLSEMMNKTDREIMDAIDDYIKIKADTDVEIPQKKATAQYMIKKAKELMEYYAAKDDEKSDEKKKDKKEDKKDEKFDISFEGDVVVVDGSGNEIVRFEAYDFTDEDLEAFNAEDIEYFTAKLKKLEDIGLVLKQKPEEVAMEDIESEMTPDEDIQMEMPEAIPEPPEETPEPLPEKEEEDVTMVDEIPDEEEE